MERYLVFARAAYAEPLSLQGTLELPHGQAPQQPALDRYGGDWVELVLIAEQDAFWALQEATPAGPESRP